MGLIKAPSTVLEMYMLGAFFVVKVPRKGSSL